jgi:hypothetical protein
MRVRAFAIVSSSVAQLTYGENLAEMYRRGAYFVDKILKGGKPADLPVEQVTKFELIINLKTAQAMGRTFPLWELLKLPRFGGATYANDHHDRSGYREVGFSGPRHALEPRNPTRVRF